MIQSAKMFRKAQNELGQKTVLTVVGPNSQLRDQTSPRVSRRDMGRGFGGFWVDFGGFRWIFGGFRWISGGFWVDFGGFWWISVDFWWILVDFGGFLVDFRWIIRLS